MHRFSGLDLGSYRGDNYFLAGYVEPNLEEETEYNPEVDAENYGWSLVQKKESPLDENTEIVRMDTRHEGPHLDKEYLPSDVDDDKIWLDDGYGFYRMRDYLLSNWQYYADLHIRYNE